MANSQDDNPINATCAAHHTEYTSDDGEIDRPGFDPLCTDALSRGPIDTVAQCVGCVELLSIEKSIELARDAMKWSQSGTQFNPYGRSRRSRRAKVSLV